MLVKILGAIDLIAGGTLALSIIAELPNPLLIIVGLIILGKSFIGFPKDIGGWIDFLTGVMLILSAFIVIPTFLKIIFALLVVQKGVSSLL